MKKTVTIYPKQKVDIEVKDIVDMFSHPILSENRKEIVEALTTKLLEALNSINYGTHFSVLSELKDFKEVIETQIKVMEQLTEKYPKDYHM